MKKKFLMVLTTGLFMVALVGLSQAAPDSSDDVYIDNNPCDWSEFEASEMKADIKMLSEGISDEEIENTQHIKLMNKIKPAAGLPQEKDDLYVEANDCNWSEFKSH